MNSDDETSTSHYYLLTSFGLSLILYLLYLELNPKLGNIWIRYDENNIRRIGWHSITGLIDFTIYPLKNFRMWFPKFWDLNPFISLSFVTTIIYWTTQYFNR